VRAGSIVSRHRGKGISSRLKVTPHHAPQDVRMAFKEPDSCECEVGVVERAAVAQPALVERIKHARCARHLDWCSTASRTRMLIRAHIARPKPALLPALDAEKDCMCGDQGGRRHGGHGGVLARDLLALTTLMYRHADLAHERRHQCQLLRLDENDEVRRQPEQSRMLAQHLGADRVERAKIHAVKTRAKRADSRPKHLSGVLRERDNEDGGHWYSLSHQIREASANHARLARSGAREEQHCIAWAADGLGLQDVRHRMLKDGDTTVHVHSHQCASSRL